MLNRLLLIVTWSKSSVCKIVKETCDVIWNVMNENSHLKVPTTKEEWNEIADKFEMRWNFPNCVEAIDGKHIVMQAPGRSGSYIILL